MKLDQLTYFVEAARQQHLSRAARTLGITPSALSHSISSLEAELGRELFRKDGKQIFLTGHGKVLAERAADILTSLQRLRTDVSSDQVELRGHYRLGATHGLVAPYLAPAWSRLRASAGAVAEFHSLRSAEVIARTASGELDFGLCFNPQYHPRVQSRLMGTTRSRVAVRAGHPVLRLPRARRGEALSAYPHAGVVELPGVESCRAHPAFQAIPGDVRTEYFYDNFDVAVGIVASSDAWAVLPDFVLEGAAGVRPAGIAGEGTLEIHALWPRSHPLTPALTRLLEETARFVEGN